MTRRIAALAALVLSAAAPAALAWTHVARPGETLEQLAERYYGRPDAQMVIRAANGFVHPDDGRLMRGERVEIPEITYHRVAGDDSWEQLADRFLGSPKRGPFLAEMNGLDPAGFPPEGTIIKVPYQLLHILAGDESLRSVARLYFGSTRSADWLRNYSLTAKKKLGRGDALLVPLFDIELVTAERERIEGERAERATRADQRRQAEAAEGIATLKERFEQGRYLEIVALAQRLLARAALTDPQKLGVMQYLAFAYTALDERQLALEAFAEALALQPAMDLSPITTSPKILELFREARRRASAPEK